MPINGRFRSFDHCVEEMIKNGREREEAMKICGALERDTENSEHGKDENKIKKKKKKMEEMEYGEPCGIRNYEEVELDDRGEKV